VFVCPPTEASFLTSLLEATGIETNLTGAALMLPGLFTSGSAMTRRHFDAVFFSFSLKLFGGAVLPVLTDATRVLRPCGRIGVVGTRPRHPVLPLPLYKWLHQRFPHVVD
jgi:hypothetical protein